MIELLFNLVPDGPGSTFLFSLKNGDPVSFRGPAGTFVLRDYPERRLLFVATGTGIAPIRSMIHARLPSPTPVTLIWGLRNERDLYYQDELAELAEQFPEFSYTVTLSQPSPSWAGAVGRVQSHIDPHIANVDDLAVYVCGSQRDDQLRDRIDPIARGLSDTPGAVLLGRASSFRSAAFCSSTLISTRSRLMSSLSRTNRLM